MPIALPRLSGSFLAHSIFRDHTSAGLVIFGLSQPGFCA